MLHPPREVLRIALPRGTRAEHLDLAAAGLVFLERRPGGRTAIKLMRSGRPPATIASGRSGGAGTARTLSSPAFDAGQVVFAEHRTVGAGSPATPCDCARSFGLRTRAFAPDVETDTYGEITGVARTRGRLYATDEFGTLVDATP